jgi:hypothetical protein
MRYTCLCWSLIPIALTVVLSYNITSVFASTSQAQPSQDEIDQSIRQVNENTRSIERLALFQRQCTDLVKSKDFSVIPICDAVTQKFNVDIGKFFAENQAAIESILYPYTLPPDIQNKLKLNSSEVIGSSDPHVAIRHNNEASGYMEKSAMLSESCVSATSLLTECMGLFKSLNDHFRDFNTNSQAEFDDILASGSIPSQGGVVKALGSNSFIDSIGYLHLVGEIENSTPNSVSYVKAIGTFYDKSNNVVATDFSYTNPTDLGPGDKAPFEIILTSASIPISQIDHQTIIVSHD